MGGSTTPRINNLATSMTRGRVTTPRPQQGVRGNQLIRPPAASLRAPMPKVNPPMAPYGGLNLNPMPMPQQPRIVPTPMPNPMPNPPAMRGPGFDDTGAPFTISPTPFPMNPGSPGDQTAQIQNPNQVSNINPSQPLTNPIYDDQGNLMNYDASSMSMFNPNMMLRPY